MLKESLLKISCNECEKEFVQKPDLMKHIKKYHSKTVAKCRDYRTGNCNLADDTCWFMHEEKPNKGNESTDEEEITLEEDKVTTNSDFREDMEKTPPDQMSQLVEIIKKLTIKVEHLEKLAQNIK